MRSLWVAAVVSFFFLIPMSADAAASLRTKSYTTKKGTYVPAHRATNPNRSKADNWSSKGNSNPYTGKAGTKKTY